MDPDIPGYSTFNKPVDDTSEHPKRDESIYRIRDPYDLAKEQGQADERDLSDSTPGYMGLGKPHQSPKTKYPYRDGLPNTHNASAEFVAALWRLSRAPVRLFHGSDQLRVGATADAILSGLDGQYQQRASACSATLKRAVIKNLRWIFSVDCGNGAKAVKIKAIRPRANIVAFGKMDLELSCSCKAWQWLGPEFHARGDGYLLGKPQGTASPPDIRDPDRNHKVCKHVASALAVARAWTIPKAKPKKKTKKAAEYRRACSVCEAYRALHSSIQEIGYEVSWDDAPGWVPSVSIRARGEAEGPAEYQILREGETWPEHWAKTEDLASLIAKVGFDVQWHRVPMVTKVWLGSPQGCLSPFM